MDGRALLIIPAAILGCLSIWAFRVAARPSSPDGGKKRRGVYSLRVEDAKRCFRQRRVHARAAGLVLLIATLMLFAAALEGIRL